jgi:hypothetical protein
MVFFDPSPPSPLPFQGRGESGSFCRWGVGALRTTGKAGFAVKFTVIVSIGAKFKVGIGRYRRQQIVFSHDPEVLPL